MMTNDEFAMILSDTSKKIAENITWQEDTNHSPTLVFQVEIISGQGWPLLMKGSYNFIMEKLSFSLIHRQAGRIYGLDFGSQHRNTNGRMVGEKHKHTWSEEEKDKFAYEPDDISASLKFIDQIWKQFCRECHLEHEGQFQKPMVSNPASDESK